VVRDEESLNRIRAYIETNPQRWHLDRDNPDAWGKDDFDRWLDRYKILPFLAKKQKRQPKEKLS
jgi:hypothetical protein